MKLYFLMLAGALAGFSTYGYAAQNDVWPLSLSEAQAIARERNHDVQLARTAIASARANIEMAGAAPNPSLTLAASSINGSNGGGALWRRPIDSVVRVDQLFERGSKRELRQENAQQLAQAAESDFTDVQRQVRSLVAQAYFDLKAAQDKRAAAIDSARLLEAMLSAAQLRKSAGDIAGADVERVKVDALRAQNDVASANGELALAKRSLALLLNAVERAEGLEAADDWPAMNPPQPLQGNQLDVVISRRPDVRAAASRVEAADAGSRLAQSLRTRDVSIGMQYEHYPQSDPTNSSGNSVGFSVQVPLFTRYYYKGEILAAEAARTSAEQNVQRVRAFAESEIGSAWSSLLAATERVKRNRDQLLFAAEKAADAAEYAYKNGAVGVMDVLDARRTLRATRLDALAAQAEFSKALSVWQAATEINDTQNTTEAQRAIGTPQDSR